MGVGSERGSTELVRAYSSTCPIDASAFVACGPTSEQLLREVAQLAPLRLPVLISGETGTGKTLLARTLHHRQRLAHARLRIVNCAALSDALLAEELALDRGDAEETVFLDEVGELSAWAQAALTGHIRALARGPATKRVIAATHRDLDAMVAAGAFSRELLAVLRTARLSLRPLRTRREEIVPLALHFLRLALHAMGIGCVGVDAALWPYLERYGWPGNARELKNAMFGALAFHEQGTLRPSDLPDAVRQNRQRVRYG